MQVIAHLAPSIRKLNTPRVREVGDQCIALPGTRMGDPQSLAQSSCHVKKRLLDGVGPCSYVICPLQFEASYHWIDCHEWFIEHGDTHANAHTHIHMWINNSRRKFRTRTSGVWKDAAVVVREKNLVSQKQIDQEMCMCK